MADLLRRHEIPLRVRIPDDRRAPGRPQRTPRRLRWFLRVARLLRRLRLI